MTDIPNLDEAKLLKNIEPRYYKEQIFTYIGPTLIVINPYKNLGNLFSVETMQKVKANLQNNERLF
jgi:myosin heavy subunit